MNCARLLLEHKMGQSLQSVYQYQQKINSTSQYTTTQSDENMLNN